MEKKDLERPTDSENETEVKTTRVTAKVTRDGKKVTLCSQSSADNTQEASHSPQSLTEKSQGGDDSSGDIQKETSPTDITQETSHSPQSLTEKSQGCDYSSGDIQKETSPTDNTRETSHSPQSLTEKSQGGDDSSSDIQKETSPTDNTRETSHSPQSLTEKSQGGDDSSSDIQKETNPCRTRLEFADELLTNIIEANEGNDDELVNSFVRIKNSEDNQSEKVQRILKDVLSINLKVIEDINLNMLIQKVTIDQLQKNRNLLAIEEKTKVRNSEVWEIIDDLSDQINYLIAVFAEVTNASGNCSKESTFKVFAYSFKKELQETLATIDLAKVPDDDIQEIMLSYKNLQEEFKAVFRGTRDLRLSNQVKRFIKEYLKSRQKAKTFPGSAHNIQVADNTVQNVTEKNKAVFQVTRGSELAEETNNIINEFQKSKKKSKTSAGSSDDIRVADNTIQNKTKQEKALDEKSSIELESKDKSDIHTFESVEEVTLGKQKCDPKAKTAFLEKGSMRAFYNDCSLDPKKILKLKSFELEEDLKSYRSKHSELDLKEDHRDLIFVEKEAVQSEPAEPKSDRCEEFGLEGNLENKTDNAKSLIKSDTELLKVIEKDNSMDFQIEYDGKKHIFIGKESYSYSSEERPTFIFGNGVQVQLTSDRISVLTPNSEFVISIRKPNSVSLNDKNTQT